MKRMNRATVPIAVASLAVLLLAGCSGTSDAGGGEDGSPASIVIAASQEPSCLNPLSACIGSGYITAIANTMLVGAYIQQPSNEMLPGIIDGEAEVTTDPFTVTYAIRDNANWSDGEPVTAADFEFTLESILAKDSTVLSTAGYNRIVNTTVNDDKSVTFEFDALYAPYKQLFNYLLPSHALEGTAFNDMLLSDIPVSNGPYQFVDWTKGQTLEITRNPEYYGNEPAIEDVAFRFITDKDTIVQQLRGGEVDVYNDLAVEESQVKQLRDIPGLVTESAAGIVFNQIRPNPNTKPLDQEYVRQAIAAGIDREEILNKLVTPVDASAQVTKNMYYGPDSPFFEPAFDYTYDPAAAKALLEENGCTLGDDDVYVCDGVPLEFTWTSVSGSRTTDLLFELIQAQLAEIGVKMNSNMVDSGTAYGKILPEGTWDFINFAPGFYDPALGDRFIRCGAQPYYAYCNEEVDALLDEGSSVADPAERAVFYNAAQDILAEEVLWVPLYPLTGTVAYREGLEGIVANGNGYATWNIQDWK